MTSLSSPIRRAGPPVLRSLSWIALFAAIAGAWVWLFGLARMLGVDAWGRAPGMTRMAGLTMDTFGVLAAMWAVMMVAMMLPTLVPALGSYAALMRRPGARAQGARLGGWWGIVAGYGAVWGCAAVSLALAQVWALRAGWIDGLGAVQSGVAAGAMLVAAGAWQFTRAKALCHGVCHAPTLYYLGHWRGGLAGGARMGAEMGLYCVGCCGAIMALGFAGGVMSLWWMGLATAFMILEKLPQVGHAVTRPAGVALLFAGCAVLVLSLG